MNVNDLKQSNFLGQKDLKKPMLVTISGCKEINVAKEGAEKEMRWALEFHELEKPMTLNITNGKMIAKIVGSDESNDWVGHKVVLFVDPNVMYGGELVGGIRVRAPKTGTIKQEPVEEPQSTDDGIPF